MEEEEEEEEAAINERDTFDTLWIMSIDSNGQYLSAFKQCKLQLPPGQSGTRARASIRVIYYKSRRAVIPLSSLGRNYPAYRVLPIATP